MRKLFTKSALHIKNFFTISIVDVINNDDSLLKKKTSILNLISIIQNEIHKHKKIASRKTNINDDSSLFENDNLIYKKNSQLSKTTQYTSLIEKVFSNCQSRNVKLTRDTNDTMTIAQQHEITSR